MVLLLRARPHRRASDPCVRDMGPSSTRRDRSTGSLPALLSVVTMQVAVAADVTDGSRPNCARGSAGSPRRVSPCRPAQEVISASLSTATVGVPSRRPHCEPRTQAAPDVAMVGVPDDQTASCWKPGSDWSVIGTSSL